MDILDPLAYCLTTPLSLALPQVQQLREGIYHNAALRTSADNPREERQDKGGQGLDQDEESGRCTLVLAGQS